MVSPVKDAQNNHWVYRAPEGLRPFFQLARYDRPVGYWLLALPGWAGLAFAGLNRSIALTDVIWAVLILIGAIAMRGAGCTYNDIVDRDLDAKVDRTALRPIPAGTISLTQAWVWLFLQCGVGLVVLLCLPRLAQIIALCAIPLVAAYPFMKRITWWPQVWLGMTFNWAVLVAYAAKTGEISPGVLILYAGFILWTVGYDTIYACQDIEDDAFAGIKSTARHFGAKVGRALSLIYFIAVLIVGSAIVLETFPGNPGNGFHFAKGFLVLPFALHLLWQVRGFYKAIDADYLRLFKSNQLAGFLLVVSFATFTAFASFVGLTPL
jgi:4-hydroxybenzoate polyprenyltransferase